MRRIDLQAQRDIFQLEALHHDVDEYIRDEVYSFEHLFLSGKQRIITLPGITIVYRDWCIPSPILMETKHENPYLKMQFELSGHSDFNSSINLPINHIPILGGCHTLLFLPETKGTLYYPRSRNVLDVMFDKDYLIRLFNYELAHLKNLGEGLAKDIPALIGPESREITFEMHRVIQDLLNCKLNGIFKKTYVEAKVIELLNLQLDQFWTIEPEKLIKLRKEDCDKLQELKRYIDHNPGNSFSLSQLSEQAGINDFKLKKGFKQLFGSTVFDYINEVRMQKSHNLLKDGICSVSQVSYLMGYKYSHHFSKAFKKKFGYSPKKVKG